MLILLLCILFRVAAACASEVEFKLVTLKNVSDRADLAIVRDELMLGSEPIERILITDVLNDGFDENDVLQIYPSGRVVRLSPITLRLDSLLRSYRLPPNVEIHETKQYYSRYDSLSRARSGGQALGYGLLGGLAERMMRGYRGESVEGYFRLAPTGWSLQAWNFDSTRVFFPPPDAPRIDTVRIERMDTIRVPEVITVTTEPVILRDTVYIPSELLRSPRGFYYREALGMFGGGYSAANRESSSGRLALGAGNEWDFGVWDPWISGRQDIHARVGLRFVTEMAPWKSDTLPPRFLATSAEGMYIPEWDRGFFVFAGVRTYYHDDLFWDRTRAAWNADLYKEAAEQDLGQYELTCKLGLDKFAAFGTAKRFGAWLKLSGWIPGGDKSDYELHLQHELTRPLAISEDAEGVLWQWRHKGGTDVEAAMTARLAESAQMMVSFGQMTIPNMEWEWTTVDGGRPPSGKGLMRVQQLYQTAAIRFAPYNKPTMRIMLEASFRNNSLGKKIKDGAEDERLLKELFFPYFETPEIEGMVRLDVSIVRFFAGARYFLPPQGHDAQIRPEAGLYLMFR
jgi:hypothetical protein